MNIAIIALLLSLTYCHFPLLSHHFQIFAVRKTEMILFLDKTFSTMVYCLYRPNSGERRVTHFEQGNQCSSPELLQLLPRTADPPEPLKHLRNLPSDGAFNQLTPWWYNQNNGQSMRIRYLWRLSNYCAWHAAGMLCSIIISTWGSLVQFHCTVLKKRVINFRLFMSMLVGVQLSQKCYSVTSDRKTYLWT